MTITDKVGDYCDIITDFDNVHTSAQINRDRMESLEVRKKAYWTSDFSVYGLDHDSGKPYMMFCTRGEVNPIQKQPRKAKKAWKKKTSLLRWRKGTFEYKLNTGQLFEITQEGISSGEGCKVYFDELTQQGGLELTTTENSDESYLEIPTEKLIDYTKEKGKYFNRRQQDLLEKVFGNPAEFGKMLEAHSKKSTKIYLVSEKRIRESNRPFVRATCSGAASNDFETYLTGNRLDKQEIGMRGMLSKKSQTAISAKRDNHSDWNSKRESKVGVGCFFGFLALVCGLGYMIHHNRSHRPKRATPVKYRKHTHKTNIMRYVTAVQRTDKDVNVPCLEFKAGEKTLASLCKPDSTCKLEMGKELPKALEHLSGEMIYDKGCKGEADWTPRKGLLYYVYEDFAEDAQISSHAKLFDDTKDAHANGLLRSIGAQKGNVEPDSWAVDLISRISYLEQRKNGDLRSLEMYANEDGKTVKLASLHTFAPDGQPQMTFLQAYDMMFADLGSDGQLNSAKSVSGSNLVVSEGMQQEFERFTKALRIYDWADDKINDLDVEANLLDEQDIIKAHSLLFWTKIKAKHQDIFKSSKGL